MKLMQRMASYWCCIGMGLVGVFLAEAVYAVNIPPIPEMSSEAAALHPELVQRRAALRLERDQLHDRTLSHNSKCGSVKEGSAAEASCASQLEALSAAVDRHIQASTQFIEDYNAAEAARIQDSGLRGAKSDNTQQPNLDPMVVDARVAPLGANLLSQVPELERSPAADRIRKGFQAVMTTPRDWPVALAWWKEALQRDPNNGALQRSVDLAQWMVDSKKRAASRQPTSYPVIDAFMRGDTAEMNRLIDQANINNAIQAADAERMTNIVNKQVKQRAAAPKLPKLSPTSATMAQMAAAGDRALSEQMFEDGLLYLNAGLYEAAEQMFRRADFQRNFDAGEPYSSSAAQNKTPGKTGKKK